jgi:RsiW-degrading membrane proteinase PrsW (M82 family)
MSLALVLVATFIIVWGGIFVVSRWLFRRSKNLTASVQRTVFVLAALGVWLGFRDLPQGEPQSYVIGALIGGALSLSLPALIAAILERSRRKKIV